MIISNLLKKLLPLILKQLMPELKPLQKYVNEPNDLDLKVKRIQKKIKRIEKRIDGWNINNTQ